MRNVLTVDVEDYFHVEAFAGSVSRDEWSEFEPRVERNVERILKILERHQTRATFFVLGWVAEKHPSLVRRIAADGHEIGSHGFGHQHLHKMTPDQVRADVHRSREVLADLAGRPVECYRAPSFSIVKNTMWAFDILADEGFTRDSSIFPVRHDLYGIPDACRFPHVQKTSRGRHILEFPPSTVTFFGNNVGIAGGGYLRLFPYTLTRRLIRHVNEKEGRPVMVYFHPWEIDPDQPRIQAPLRSRFRHYTNLAGMEGKIERLLQDFRFTTLSEVCQDLALDRAAVAAFAAQQ